jgi:tRNA A-37 threonylcarbamoyl transferase component Bud32
MSSSNVNGDSFGDEIDVLCDRFEAEWKAGGRPEIKKYVAGAPTPARPGLVRELLKLDIDYRRKCGETPMPDEYKSGLSEYAGLIDVLLAETAPYTLRPTKLAIGNGIEALADRYQIEGRIDGGGMGEVYRARQLHLDKLVALKLIRPEYLPSDAARERFRTEARALAKLDHPHIVRVFDGGESGGQPYLAMELVEGGTLAQAAARGQWAVDGSIAARRVAGIVETLARAVDYAHQRGVVHRDLKPANVLLTADGTPKIADLGLARLLDSGLVQTQPGHPLGTYAYMAPEQANGQTDTLGPATDIYGLGGILYHLLTGRAPHPGSTREEVLDRAKSGKVTPPSQLNPCVPAALERICLEALAPGACERYPSAAALADDLRRYRLFSQRLKIMVAALAGAAFLGLAVWLLVVPTHPKPLNQLSGGSGGDNVVHGLAAKLDVRIWKKADTSKGLDLGTVGALPLRAGDFMRVEAETNRPAYLYVIYLDAQGEAAPLFPWRQDDWNDRPAEQKRTRLHLPEDPLKDGAPLTPGASGIEAVLLLARDEPLSAEEVGGLRRLFDKAAPAKFDPLRGAVWLGAEEWFGNPQDRSRPNLDQSGTVLDPVERLRRLVRGGLKSLAGDVRGVCYPFDGK